MPAISKHLKVLERAGLIARGRLERELVIMPVFDAWRGGSRSPPAAIPQQLYTVSGMTKVLGTKC